MSYIGNLKLYIYIVVHNIEFRYIHVYVYPRNYVIPQRGMVAQMDETPQLQDNTEQENIYYIQKF